MLGPSLADRVRAHTFHSLGLGLVRRFPDLLGLPGQPTLIDRAQRRRLARTLIREHDLYRDALAQGRDAVLDEFDAHAEQFWNLGLPPAATSAPSAPPAPPALDAFARDWRHRLESAPAADPLVRDAELARCNRFTDHARLFTLLLRACRQRGWVSFGDLITLPIELLARSAAARAIIRDETRHVVVDEYQDVNPAQIALLTALAPPPPPDRTDLPGPDLCAVGDDDQAIYAFRGADDLAFPRFAQHYPRHTVIPLVENYRSVPAVLAASDRVIAGSHSRFRPDKHLRATRAPNSPAPNSPAPGTLPPVLAVKLAAELDDGPPIAALILAERARAAAAVPPNPSAPPRPWSDFAVIARTHSDLARIAAALELEGIPTAVDRAEGALGDQGVQDLLAWLELLVEPRAVWSARRLLIRPPIGVPHDAALALEQAFHADARTRRLDDPAAETPGFAAWLRARLAESTRSQTPAPSPNADALARFLRLHDALAADAATLSGEQALWRIATQADLAHADLRDGRERARRVDALVAMLRFARVVQPRLDAPGDLRALRDHLADLSDNDLNQAITLDDAVEPGATDESPEPDSPEPGVRLLTAHAAKGLEFPWVFVPRAQAANGYPNSKKQNEPELLPPGLADRGSDPRALPERRADEERRLFYVACTRAQDQLILLSKWPQKWTATVSYVRELVAPDSGPPRVTPIDAAEVLTEAARAGVTLRGSSGLPDEPRRRGEARLPSFRDELTRARQRARLEAAQALDAAERPDLDARALADIAARLRDAAARLAVAAAVDSGADAPPPCAAGPDAPPHAAAWTDAHARLLALRRRTAPPAGGPPPLAPRVPEPPLHLSYTTIHAYQHCPRCYYLRYVLRASEPPSVHATIGSAVHTALEAFYDRWRRADSGEPDAPSKPALDDLLALGRAACRDALARGEPLPDDAPPQILALLSNAFTKLHAPNAHVLEVERTVRFTYPRSGHDHIITAKIDRIDLAPDGAQTIIDYKTGRASKRLREPPPDDLQLGIYAMALAGSHEPPPELLSGSAEYWILSTGDRGSIPLASLNLPKVRDAIDAAIDGILAGRFDKSNDCTGDCDFLGP